MAKGREARWGSETISPPWSITLVGNRIWPFEGPVRIACVDHDRVSQQELKQFLEVLYSSCHHSIGHLLLPTFYTASKEEVEINYRPDAVIVGWKVGVESAYRVCKSIRAAHPEVPVFVFFEDTDFSLRNLSRFQAITTDQFKKIGDDPHRIVHRLSTQCTVTLSQPRGKLVTVCGVKGGVGATSVVSGLAHASDVIAKKSVVLDLSPSSIFAFYAGADRLHSMDYKSALMHRVTPDAELVTKCIVQAPNGINILLPPAEGSVGRNDGSQIRELWIRDPERFEFTLQMVEILQEMFDAVWIDIGGAEGVLSYAIQSRADRRLIVSSNDPASVHLLSRLCSALNGSPAQGQPKILLNTLATKGLSPRDIKEFLSFSEHFDAEMASLPALCFDQKAQRWIGTGNSFYTEGSKAIQRTLEQICSQLIVGDAIRTESGKANRKRWQSLLQRRVESARRLSVPALDLPNSQLNVPLDPELIRPALALDEDLGSVESNLLSYYSPPKQISVNELTDLGGG